MLGPRHSERDGRPRFQLPRHVSHVLRVLGQGVFAPALATLLVRLRLDREGSPLRVGRPIEPLAAGWNTTVRLDTPVGSHAPRSEVGRGAARRTTPRKNWRHRARIAAARRPGRRHTAYAGSKPASSGNSVAATLAAHARHARNRRQAATSAADASGSPKTTGTGHALGLGPAGAATTASVGASATASASCAAAANRRRPSQASKQGQRSTRYGQPRPAARGWLSGGTTHLGTI